MNKVIIVGATSGIGYELALLLLSKGYCTGITGRRSDKLEIIRQQYPETCFTQAFDATDKELSIHKLEELVMLMQGLDLLVISSGTGGLNEELDQAIEQKTFDLNVTGFANIAIWAFKFFMRQGYGHLTGISSIAGLRGSRGAPAYFATKAFQINYLESLRNKAVKLNLPITVTDIRPGFVDTAMAQGDGLFWVAKPQKAAKQIYKAIIRKKSVAYITKRWIVFAWLLKILPRYIINKM